MHKEIHCRPVQMTVVQFTHKSDSDTNIDGTVFGHKITVMITAQLG
jgi:hypothetical protein